jgi:hypothetical protein
VLLSNASDGDAIAVLPAAFYTVGWSYYLHQEDIRHVHAGPSTWQYYPQGDRHVRVFGPIRSFGVPIETFVGHVDIRRLWIAVFNENIFGQPEFAEDLPAHVLSTLDERLTRVKRWRFPFMDLILYTVPLPQLWQGEGAGGVEVDVNRLYRSIRWLPDALDPDYLFEVSRGKKPVRIRLPAPTGTPQLSITIRGAPEDARASAVRVRDRSLRFEGNTWQGDIAVDRSDYVDVTLERDPEAMRWPLKVVIRP